MTVTFLVRAGLPMLVFAGFVVLTLRVRRGDTPGTSAPLRMLIFYVVLLSMFAGLSGRDLWPFAAWRYVSYAAGESGDFFRLVGVDESDREHALDARAFQPLQFNEVLGYLGNNIEHMPRAHRIELLDFLLLRAQEGLAQARGGHPVDTFTRFLGPLSAPVFNVEATPWVNRNNFPRELAELRFYRVYWRVTGAVARFEKQVLVARTRS